MYAMRDLKEKAFQARGKEAHLGPDIDLVTFTDESVQ
jgi:hypothetical protein